MRRGCGQSDLLPAADCPTDVTRVGGMGPLLLRDRIPAHKLVTDGQPGLANSRTENNSKRMPTLDEPLQDWVEEWSIPCPRG